MTADRYSTKPQRDDCGLTDIELLDKGLQSNQLGEEDEETFIRLRAYISGRKKSQAGHTMPRNVSGRTLTEKRRAWVYRIVAGIDPRMDPPESSHVNVGVLHKYPPGMSENTPRFAARPDRYSTPPKSE
jgi:hypothetical protein